MNLATQGILAILPVITIMVIMLVFRWSAARAGVIGLFVTVLLSWLVFGFGSDVYGNIGTVAAMGGALSEAVFTSTTILWIIFPALCIHHLQVHTGAIDTVKLKTASLSTDPRIAALLIFWFFALFIEGLAGFGTPVALTAPFLVSMGFRPVDSVALALIGHSVGVSFGAVGTPILPQIASTGFDGLELSGATGLYHGILGWVMILIAMFMVTKSMQVRKDASGHIWVWTFLAAVLFLFPFFGISRWVGPELPTLGGALFGGLGFVAILKIAGGGNKQSENGPPAKDIRGSRGKLLRVTAPYWILVSLILITRLIPGVREVLNSFAWEWTLLDTFHGRFEPFYHPGTMLFVGFVAGALVQRAGQADMKAAVSQSIKKLLPVTIALVAMLSLSRIMIHSGMIDSLSAGAAHAAGSFWPILSPMVGVLGTFVTGSATASNILFTDFQQTVARNLGLPVLTMIGAQGFGAAVGNIICPHNIIAGGATVGLAGQEGKILGKTILACSVYSLLGGLLAIWLTR
ncbi:MAG: L-lactate permease [Nitrospirota bacterium]